MRNEALRNPPSADKQIFILCFLLMFLSLGCESKEFKAERLMVRANKLTRAIEKDPKGTPEIQFVRALRAYTEIVDKYPGSFFADQARFGIARLYLILGRFQRARVEYDELVRGCGRKENLCAEALFGIGSSYEAQNQWDEALAVYKSIIQNYPFSVKSLDLPVTIIKHYRRAADDKNIRIAVDDAVSYYRGLKGRIKGSNADYMLERCVARAYTEGRQWQEALDSLEKLVRDYPKNNPEEALLLRFLIYADKLKDNLKAKEEVARILNDYPGSKIAQKVEAYLKKTGP